MESLQRTRGIDTNDLHASDGRDTEALNCKPNTNLKEIFELSNYCKSSGYRLHAVSSSALTNVLKIHAQLQMSAKTCINYSY